MLKNLLKIKINAILIFSILISTFIVADTAKSSVLQLDVETSKSNTSEVLLKLYINNAKNLGAANFEISYDTDYYKYISHDFSSLDSDDIFVDGGLAFDQDGILTLALSSKNEFYDSNVLLAVYRLEKIKSGHADFNIDIPFIQGVSISEAKTIYISDDNNYQYSINKDGNIVIIKYIGKTNVNEIYLPSKIYNKDVTEIAENAFSINNLNIHIPNTINKISKKAFQGSTNVKIFCHANSYAHNFAKENNINFYISCKGDEHYFNNEWEIITKPTCITKGVKRQYCECKKELRTQEMPLANHSFGAWKTTLTPTISREGIEQRKCAVCTTTETRKIPMLSKDKIHFNIDLNIKIMQDGKLGQILYLNSPLSASYVLQLSQNDDIEIKNSSGKTLNGDDLVGSASRISLYRSGIVIDSYLILLRFDANGDGKITASDTRSALRISAKMETLKDWHELALDANSDQKLTASDARAILRVSAKL